MSFDYIKPPSYNGGWSEDLLTRIDYLILLPSQKFHGVFADDLAL